MRAWARFSKRLSGAGGSYAWSEDFDESLNFWFWLRRTGSIDDAGLIEGINQWARSDSMVERHLRVSDHKRWHDYGPVWKAWKTQQVERHLEQQRLQKPSVARARYGEMASLGVKLRVQWVMAPQGERWLVPPDQALLGVEGGTIETQQTAVLQAAQIFHKAAGDWKSLK